MKRWRVFAILLLGSLSRSVVATTTHCQTTGRQAQKVGEAIELYRHQFGRLPTQMEGLRVLDGAGSGRPIMDQVPKDSWGRNYSYRVGAAWPAGFEVRSAGPDGVFATDDDITDARSCREPLLGCLLF
jgi:hypothetical protein